MLLKTNENCNSIMKLLILFALVTACVCRISTDYKEEDRYAWVPGDDGYVFADTQTPLSEEDFRQAERSGSANQYWLFTRQNRANHQILRNGSSVSIRLSNYNPGLPILVLIHGYLGKGHHEMNVQISREYLELVAANVIVLDWSSAAMSTYPNAVNSVRSVGEALAGFLDWLFSEAGGRWSNVHIVGYSLGAHVAGRAGRSGRARPARITGLDPAGPRWRTNLGDALNRNDAFHVESIHTEDQNYGIHMPISHADFYPNGGLHPQPGCRTRSCSHARSHDLFTASVRNNRFVGTFCINMEEMRLNQCRGRNVNMGNTVLSKRQTGIYRLTTRSLWPYHAI